MFEQFKENIRLTGETYTEVRQGFKSALAALRNAPRFKKYVCMSVVVAIVVSSIASKFSVPWYYEVLLVGIAVLPAWVWAGRPNEMDS